MKLSKRANQFIFSKGFYDIKEWDDSTDVVLLVPIVTEDNFVGYRMTYPDGETHEVSTSYAKELVVSPLSTVEANKMFYIKKLSVLSPKTITPCPKCGKRSWIRKSVTNAVSNLDENTKEWGNVDEYSNENYFCSYCGYKQGWSPIVGGNDLDV